MDESEYQAEIKALREELHGQERLNNILNARLTHISAQTSRVMDLVRINRNREAMEKLTTILVMAQSKATLPREGSDGE